MFSGDAPHCEPRFRDHSFQSAPAPRARSARCGPAIGSASPRLPRSGPQRYQLREGAAQVGWERGDRVSPPSGGWRSGDSLLRSSFFPGMGAGVRRLSPARNLRPGLVFALPRGAWRGLRTATRENRAGGCGTGAGLAPLTLRDPGPLPEDASGARAQRPAARAGPAWPEGAPDLGFSPVPGLLKDHGRRAEHGPAAGSAARPGLRRRPALGALRTRPRRPLQARPRAPCAPEEARIRCHQEPASQQGKGPGR